MTTEKKEQSPTSSLDLCEKLVVDFSKIDKDDKGMPNVYINILKTYSGEERYYRIMLEAVKMIDLYKYEHEPAMPVYVHEKWHTVKADVEGLPPDKKSEYWKKLNMNEDAAKYFKDCDGVMSRNLSNALFLEDMLAALGKAGDNLNYLKALAVYNKYPVSIGIAWKRKLL